MGMGHIPKILETGTSSFILCANFSCNPKQTADFYIYIIQKNRGNSLFLEPISISKSKISYASVGPGSDYSDV